MGKFYQQIGVTSQPTFYLEEFDLIVWIWEELK